MNGKKILISGGSGNLARELWKYGDDYDIIALSKIEMDIRKKSDIDLQIFKNKPDYFIHSGALTRPMNIHEEDPARSIETNIIGTSNVVLSCMKYNIKLIYISTDYVYPGSSGNYREEDFLKPFTKYGWSKLGGECSVRLYDNHLILRVSMNQKPFPHKKALVDMRKSLMYIEDAAQTILKLLNETGTINVGGKSQSVFEFVQETNPNIGRITLKEIEDVEMATDCSMNISKMEKILL